MILIGAQGVIDSAGGVVPPVHFWALDDGGGGPYSDTGTTGGEDMSQIGTVTDDGTFNGISVTGSGAVAAPDTSSVWDNLFTGSDKKFSLKIEIEFDSTGSDQYFLTRLNTTATERSFWWILRSGGTNLDFFYAGANNGSSFRGVRTVLPTLSTATSYKIALSYDGSIDTNNGLDRLVFFLDGTEYAPTTLSGNTGSLLDMVATGAQLAVGGGVSGAGALQLGSSINAKNLAVYDYLIDATEAGA